MAPELDRDGGSAEIGSHGVVTEGIRSEDDDGQLVEEPGTAGALSFS